MKLRLPILLVFALLSSIGMASATSSIRAAQGNDEIFENHENDILYEDKIAVIIGGVGTGGIINAIGNISFSQNTGGIIFKRNTSFNGQLHAEEDVLFSGNGGVILFDDNDAPLNGMNTGQGGAIYAGSNADFEGNTNDISFTLNKAGVKGGAIYAGHSIHFSNNTKGIKFANNFSGGAGGAIYAEKVVFFSENEESVQFIKNESKQSKGGAIYASNIIFQLNEGVINFEGNKSPIYDGGAIYCDGNVGGGEVLFYDNKSAIRFVENETGGKGAAIYGENDIQFQNNPGEIFFHKNTSKGSGGAVYTKRPVLFLENEGKISFLENKVNPSSGSGGSGGAIYCQEQIKFQENVGGILFEKNSTQLSGGAIYVADTVTFTQNEGGISFTGNETVYWGGAIYASNGITFENNKGDISFTENKASYKSGVSAIYSDKEGISFFNNENISFTGNVGGGAVIKANTTFLLINNGSFSMESNSGSCSIETADLIIAGNKGDISISGTLKPDNTKGLAIRQTGDTSSALLAANDGKKIVLRHGSSFNGNVVINGTTKETSFIRSKGTVILGNGGETEGIHTFEKDLTVKGGTLAVDVKSSLLFGENSSRNVVVEQGATFKNNGTIKGGNISIHSGATLSGSGLFTGNTVVMQDQARWNIGNSPGVVRLDNSHLTVGSNCSITLSLDGKTAASVGSPSGWGSGTYSILMLEGGSSLNQLNPDSTVNIVMSKEFKNGLVLGEYNDTLFDFIKKSADSTGDFSLLNQENIEFFVTNGVSEINVTEALGDQFVINSGEGLFSLKFDVEKGTPIPDPAPEPEPIIPTLGNSALASMVGDSLWGSTFTLRQMSDVVQNNVGRASFIPMDGKYKSQAWFSALGGYNTIESTASTMGASYQQYGYALGAQTQVHSTTTAGLAFGQSWGKSNLDQSSGKIDQDMLMVGLYSESCLHKTEKAFYTLQLGAIYGSDSNIGKVEGERGEWNNDNWMLSALVKANYIITPKTIVSPFVAMEWNYSASEDFTTTGGYNLHYNGDSLSSLRSRIGVAASHQLCEKWVAYTSVAILLDMARNNPESLVYQDSFRWKTSTTNLDRTSFAYQVGTSYALTPQWSANLGYVLEVNSETLQQSGNVGVSYKF